MVGVHHAGRKTGYGLTVDQAAAWVASPLVWLARRKGRLTSNFVEAGAFYRAAPVGPDGDARPDVQTHFIPYMMGYRGRSITTGSGYFADVGVCRPTSRGRLSLSSADPAAAPQIDLGLLSDPADLAILVAGFGKLRALMAEAPLEGLAAPEVYPAGAVTSTAEIENYVRTHCSTAYHPVGTLAMGREGTPVTPDLKLRQVEGLWVADASVMPQITSANTNAPSMMIGHRAAGFIRATL